MELNANTIIFFDQEESISDRDIQQLEDLVGFKFPQSYREHILKYNGGRCKPNVYSFSEDGQITESDLNVFLSLPDELRDYILDYKVEDIRILENFLPIAEDSLGNLVCICCEGEDAGRIYFWDHEREGEENIHFIADSFDEFLNSLKDFE
jgi:hypothetical protein